MCGIVFSFDASESSQSELPSELWDELTRTVNPRGPDFQNQHEILLNTPSVSEKRRLSLRFHAAVLHMRGREITQQPFVSENGDVLVFNGEIFDGLHIPPEANDGEKLYKQLQISHDFISTLQSMEGPYAVVFYEAARRRLWFARDPLGRRSLLLLKPTSPSPSFILASTWPGGSTDGWEEVDCSSVHHLDLDAVCLGSETTFISSIPRTFSNSGSYPGPNVSTDYFAPCIVWGGDSDENLYQPYPFRPLTQKVPAEGDRLQASSTGMPVVTGEMSDLIQELIAQLEEAVRKRAITIPPIANDGQTPPGARVAVLFSGGLDCSTLALLLDGHIPPEEPIDLLNVAFENPNKIESQARVQKNLERSLVNNKKRKAQVAKAGRIGDDPGGREVGSEGSQEAVAPMILSPKSASSPYDVPDRLTGLSSLEELRKLRPGRKWNFVHVNVPYEEYRREREKIMQLMFPQDSVMDLSIAAALFFASRGVGEAIVEGEAIPYTSPARVLISCLGADELMGGYSHHRSAFASGSWSALIASLQEDVDRLPYRNLGRDDRIISSHGKEARFPFLSAPVIDFLSGVPIQYKTDIGFGEGLGDKMILRLAARELGMERVWREKKRAVQFGSRSAKIDPGEQGKKKGHQKLGPGLST